MNWMSLFLALLQLAGGKIPAVWPHLKVIATELTTIMSIIQGTTPEAFATRGLAGAPSPKLAEAKQLAMQYGVPANEADELSKKFATVDQHLPQVA